MTVSFEKSSFRVSARIQRTIYFGGGTPSLLNAALLGRVVRSLPGVPAEVSIEVNPGTLSDTKVQEYRDLGISRISLGAQSLEDEDLVRAGRLHKAGAVFSDFEMLRQHGFAQYQSRSHRGSARTANRDLGAAISIGVLELEPEHISIYMLDQEERSAWARLPAGVPEDDDFAAFYSLAETKLDAARLPALRNSNWALAGEGVCPQHRLLVRHSVSRIWSGRAFL